jgi:hypothetical protein
VNPRPEQSSSAAASIAGSSSMEDKRPVERHDSGGISATTTILLVVVAVAAYLGARTVVFPGVPVLLGGDQSFFWMYAERMLRGERVYRDFFQFTLPGTDVVFLAAFALFGARIWVADAIVVGLGVALAAICFRLARGIMGAAEAALATAIFTVLVFGQALNATHHWFSLLAIMSAVAVLSQGSTPRRCALAGGLLGLASFFTQSHGLAALLAFSVFTRWQAGKAGLAPPRLIERYVGLLGGFGAGLLGASAYFIVTVGVGPIWSCSIVYVWRYMRHGPFALDLGLPEALTWTSLPWLLPYLIVDAMIPAAYALTLALEWRARDRSGGNDSAPRALLWLVGVALLGEVAANPSWVRLFGVSMPAVILFVSSLGRASKRRHLFHAAAWSGVFALSCIFLRSTYRHHTIFMDLPGGRVATNSLNREKLSWLAQHEPAGGALFAANGPNLYLPLGLHNPIFWDGSLQRQNAREDVERAVDELETRRVARVLWTERLDELKSEQQVGNLAALRSYLHDRYRLERTFADGDEVWERR